MKRRILVTSGAILAAMVTTTLVLSITARGTHNGLFWLKCNYSHSAPDDPIVYPEQPGASHLHDFFGNESTDAFSTYNTMQMADTKCKLSTDTAGYWFPALLRADGTKVQALSVNAYYWGEVGLTEVYPPNFKFVARPGLGQHAWYSCMGADNVHYTSLPNCALTSNKHVKGAVEFPSCWDGVNLTYPSGDNCDDIYLPRLVLHVEWNVIDASGMRLASGDATTLHADFWNTWNQAILEDLIDRCITQDQSCKNLSDGAR